MRTPAVLDGHTSNKPNFRAPAIGVVVAVAAVLAIAMAGCKSIAPDAGHEVVLVESQYSSDMVGLTQHRFEPAVLS